MKALTANKISSLLLFAAVSIVMGQTNDAECLGITAPRPATILSQPICTLRVSGCADLVSLSAALQYTGSDGVSQEVTPLGSTSKPPFDLIVKLDTFPDQLVTGMAFIAQGLLANGRTVIARCEGVFYTRQQPVAAACEVAAHDGLGRLKTTRFTLGNRADGLSADVQTSWNRGNLIFDVRVTDSSYKVDLPQDKLAAMGIEVLVDPSQNPLPYPGDSVVAFDIPLAGHPVQRIYRPIFGADGSYKLTIQVKKQELPVEVFAKSAGSWRIKCQIPFDRPITAGRQIRCNVVVKPVPGSDKKPLSWNTASSTMYAPTCWSILTPTGGEFWAGSLFLWSVSFAAAFIIVVIIGSFTTLRRRKMRQMSMRRNDEIPAEHRELVTKIRALVESRVTDRTSSIESAAVSLGIPEASINRLCKRHFGWPFHLCLMLSRTEVARERLRSSNSPEKSIAEMCGFESLADMEKYFLKFYHTTPAKYRQEQQVT